jgi:predicted nucleotidyltransferase component of viral defense system
MLWRSLHQKAREYQLPLSTVVAEVLHLAVLDGLFSRVESEAATFQGGTSIHLLHGGYRFSEDLDFAGPDLTWAASENLMRSAQNEIEKLVTQLLGVGQNAWRLPQASKGRRIYVAWFAFQPQQVRQKFRVKIEFANYPVYLSQPLPVRSEFDVTQRLSLVNGLPPAELMAEKLAAVAGRTYVKGRDLFDLWFFREVLKTDLDVKVLQKKLRDYHVKITKTALRAKLKSYSPALLVTEMSRFLPLRYRRMLEKDSYHIIRSSATKLIEEAWQTSAK